MKNSIFPNQITPEFHFAQNPINRNTTPINMNLSLLDPFALAQEYPESQSAVLAYGQSGCVKFNRTGDYLASGLLDGTIAIFDCDTNGVLLVLRGHSRPVQSLSWSHDGRHLLSGSRDWKCILWDLKSGGREKRVFSFESPVWSAFLHPHDSTKFVVSLFEDDSRYVELGPTSKDTKIMVLPSSAAGKETALVTRFSANGEYIIAGTSKGNINVIRTGTDEVLTTTRISSSNIKNMVLSSNGRFLVVNSSDRVVRLVSVPRPLLDEPRKDEEEAPPPPRERSNSASSRSESASPNSPKDEWLFEVEHKFQDVVNRLQWNAVSISPTAEYVVASTYEAAHDIYMWETSMGSLVKIYEGPKEELVDVEWHPTRPAVAATGLDSGKIYLWTSIVPQRWSALAPDFIEVEENVEYQEREDEFDVEDETAQNQRQLDDEDEEVVDVMTMDEAVVKETGWFSIPVSLDLEDEESASDNDE